MFEFKLFNIPVRVEPFFWVIGFIFGHGLDIRGRESLFQTLIWMIVVFVSILIHEFGHALTSRKLTGVTPDVKLWAMGGLAYPNTQLSRKQSFWVTWAGPLAGLGFFAVIALICCLAYGFDAGSGIISYYIYSPDNRVDSVTYEALQSMSGVTKSILRSLIFINFWWSFVNLLPVFPLDGGQIYASVETSQKKVFQVGLVTGIIVAIISLVQFQQLYPTALFGYLAYQNYQRLQQIGGGR